jgi:hypothetical protein
VLLQGDGILSDSGQIVWLRQPEHMMLRRSPELHATIMWETKSRCRRVEAHHLLIKG